jgi:hypothetical protein
VSPQSPAIKLDLNDCSKDLPDMTMYVRRRGLRCGAVDHDWLLKYEAFERTIDGQLVFLFDDKIFDLPPGRYEGQVRYGCRPCGSVELDMSENCSFKPAGVTAVDEYKPLRLARPEGIDDMYDAILDFKVTLCGILEEGETVLPQLKQPADVAVLCAAFETMCKAPELKLYDTTKHEIIKLVGCENGRLVVERGQADTLARRFPTGSCLEFAWTSTNVKNATEGCP